MARIHVTDCKLLNNHANLKDDFEFEITFNCINPGIKGEMEWKVTYVGSADDSVYDQVLDTALVGPCPIGKSRFILRTPGPDPSKVPKKDLIGVTVLLLTCSYKDQEFIRIGYYVSLSHPDVKLQKKLNVNSENVPDKENENSEKENEENDNDAETKTIAKNENKESEENNEKPSTNEPTSEKNEKLEIEKETSKGEVKAEEADEENSKEDERKIEDIMKTSREQENEYEFLIPDNLDMDKIDRNVLDKEPRITRFKIKWDEEEENDSLKREREEDEEPKKKQKLEM